MKQCDTCGNSDAWRVCAWLIEGNGCYWDGHYPDSRSFTPDVSKAIKFLSFEDAETVKYWLFTVHAFALKSTQHCWVNGVHDE